jgi:hypothetical protein
MMAVQPPFNRGRGIAMITPTKWKTVALAVTLVVTATEASPSLAQADYRDIEGKPGKAWQHQPTKIELPASIAGIERSRIIDTTRDEWDVFANYQSTDGNDFISLYVFESQLPDARISFEQSVKAITSRPAQDLENFGTIQDFTPPIIFSPNENEPKAGVRQTFALTGASMRSTAIAVFPYAGNWLIKVRISSRNRSAEAMDALLSQVLAEWKRPKDDVKQRDANAIADCVKPLGTLPRSENVKFKKTQDLMNVALGPVGSNIARTSYSRPVHCLAATMADGKPVFQQLDNPSAYVIPVSDNGAFIAAENDVLGSILAFDPSDPTAMEKKRADPDFNIVLHTPGQVIVYHPQTTLPPPDQSVEIVDRTEWVAMGVRNHKDSEKIDINPKFIDEADRRRFGIK